MKKEINDELNEALKYNLSFAGCGFLGIYHGELIVCDVLCFFYNLNCCSLQLALLCASRSMHLNFYYKRYRVLVPVPWRHVAYLLACL